MKRVAYGEPSSTTADPAGLSGLKLRAGEAVGKRLLPLSFFGANICGEAVSREDAKNANGRA